VTRAQIRFVAHQMHEHVQWLDKHATVRRKEDARKLEDIIVDLEKAMLRFIGAPLRDEAESPQPPQTPTTETAPPL
jgi:hypothetical protein